MGDYNGHPSWAYWNVSLWVANDEGLYDLARECIRGTANRREAAESMFAALREGGCGHPETPDGAAYSVAKIRHAMRGL